MVRNTTEAARLSGMPLTHAACFQNVANNMNCMIASRSVGIYATGLILENYASKGYHVKTKSCNWRPMAGFVLSDPRFSKKGDAGVASQRAAIIAANYTGGNMVHHSDETGRPQIFDVEMDFIAFIPRQNGSARFVRNMTEYRGLIRECIRDYSISLNSAWGKALGFGVSQGGNFEW